MSFVISLIFGAILLSVGFYGFTILMGSMTGNEFSFDKIRPPSLESFKRGSEPKDLSNIEPPESDNSFKEGFKPIQNIKDALPLLSENGDREMTDEDAFVKRYNITEEEWKTKYAKRPEVDGPIDSNRPDTETVVERLVIKDDEGDRVWIAKQAKGVENDTVVYMSESLAIKNTPNSRGEIVNDLSYYSN